MWTSLLFIRCKSLKIENGNVDCNVLIARCHFLIFLKENVISALRIEGSHGNIVEGGSLLGLYTLSTGIYLQH